MTRCCFRAIALAIVVLAGGPALADDIVASWATVRMPQAPQLKAVKVEAHRTALLLLDFDKNTCNAEKLPRCFATLPVVAKLLADARSHGLSVAYSTVATGSVEDEPPALAAQPGDPVVRSGVDKFVGTDLAEVLQAKNIRTVIVTEPRRMARPSTRRVARRCAVSRLSFPSTPCRPRIPSPNSSRHGYWRTRPPAYRPTSP
jgi:hypothetical protein